jgi:hypothetical protein
MFGCPIVEGQGSPGVCLQVAEGMAYRPRRSVPWWKRGMGGGAGSSRDKICLKVAGGMAWPNTGRARVRRTLSGENLRVWMPRLPSCGSQQQNLIFGCPIVEGQGSPGVCLQVAEGAQRRALVEAGDGGEGGPLSDQAGNPTAGLQFPWWCFGG